jgi:hypothetical protein
MSDYFDRVERQLVRRADALYSPGAVGSLSVQRSRAYKLSRGHRGASGAFGLVCAGQRLRRFATHRLAGLGLGVIGGLVAALIVSLGASPAPPDFTVSRGKGRLVTIKVANPSSIPALNSKLASLGIPIRAAKVLSYCVAPAQARGSQQLKPAARTLDVASMPLVLRRLKGDSRALLSVRVAPPTRRRETLLLAAGGSGAETLGQLILGSAPVCVRGGRHESALLAAPS